MNALSAVEIDLLRSVFRRHTKIRAVKLFGSRAKGTGDARSDVDLAIWGDVDGLLAEQIAAELDELPLPYRYDVKAFDHITLPALRAHIERVGVSLYPEIGVDARIDALRSSSCSETLSRKPKG